VVSRRKENDVGNVTVAGATRNAELIEDGYEAFGRGDMAALEALFDPSILWHAQRLGRLGGDHRGWSELMAFFGETMDLTEGSFNLEVKEILANDDGAAVVVRSRARRGDAALDSLQIHHFHIRDERGVEVWQFVDDGAGVEAFWS
jgi:ketosteroid isomerase-like protein